MIVMDNFEINLADWYTAKEAAEKLGTSPKYVRTLAIQYKKFKTYKLHELVMLYWKEDVDNYQIDKEKPGRPSKNKNNSKQKAA